VPPACGPGGPSSASLGARRTVPARRTPRRSTTRSKRSKGHDHGNAAHGSRAGRRRRQWPSQAGHGRWPGLATGSAASKARRTSCWLSMRTRRALRSRPLPGLRPRERPAGPLLAGAAPGASAQGQSPVGPPRRPAGCPRPVAVGRRDLAGRGGSLSDAVTAPPHAGAMGLLPAAPHLVAGPAARRQRDRLLAASAGTADPSAPLFARAERLGSHGHTAPGVLVLDDSVRTAVPASEEDRCTPGSCTG
jgi:hypothetical protein